MYNAALELGVNPDDMVMEKQSRDTEEEAVYIRQMLGDRKVYTCHIRLSYAKISGPVSKAGDGPGTFHCGLPCKRQWQPETIVHLSFHESRFCRKKGRV